MLKFLDEILCETPYLKIIATVEFPLCCSWAELILKTFVNTLYLIAGWATQSISVEELTRLLSTLKNTGTIRSVEQSSMYVWVKTGKVKARAGSPLS